MSELTFEIGLAIAPNGAWHVCQQGTRDPRVSAPEPVHAAVARHLSSISADVLGVGAKQVIVTLRVPVPETPPIERVEAAFLTPPANGSTNGNRNGISNRAETREAAPATIDSSRGGATSREQGGGV